MFCFNCGKEIEDNALYCSHCGTKLNNQATNNSDKTMLNLEYNKIKSNMIFAYVYWLLFGFTGLHRFYLGQYWFFVIYWLLLLLYPFGDEIFFIMLGIWLIDGLILWQGVVRYNDELKEKFDNNDTETINPLNNGCLVSFLYIISVIVIFFVYLFVLHMFN